MAGALTVLLHLVIRKFLSIPKTLGWLRCFLGEMLASSHLKFWVFTIIGKRNIEWIWTETLAWPWSSTHVEKRGSRKSWRVTPCAWVYNSWERLSKRTDVVSHLIKHQALNHQKAVDFVQPWLYERLMIEDKMNNAPVGLNYKRFRGEAPIGKAADVLWLVNLPESPTAASGCLTAQNWGELQ